MAGAWQWYLIVPVVNLLCGEYNYYESYSISYPALGYMYRSSIYIILRIICIFILKAYNLQSKIEGNCISHFLTRKEQSLVPYRALLLTKTP